MTTSVISHLFMDSIFSYQAFLFDFDGLLVDTEPLHYAAYMHMARERGCPLDWDFTRFCQEAHSREGGFFDGLQREYPHVFDQGISREILYARKKQLYVESLQKMPLSLMHGAAPLLEELALRQIKRAVVTNSPRNQIELIQSRLPLLKTIPVWVTREDYTQAKPSADGYLKALTLLSTPAEKAIGLEDSLKGVKALLAAHVDAVFVCSPSYLSLIDEARKLGAHYAEGLLDLLRN